MATTKQFRMTPTFRLDLGPDFYHLVCTAELSMAQVLDLLSDTPENHYRRATQAGDDKITDILATAVYDWNSTYASDPEGEDQEYGCRGWKWAGISVSSECDGVRVRVRGQAGEKGIVTVDVAPEHMESQARACALAAYEALLPVVKPEGNR